MNAFKQHDTSDNSLSDYKLYNKSRVEETKSRRQKQKQGFNSGQGVMWAVITHKSNLAYISIFALYLGKGSLCGLVFLCGALSTSRLS